MDMEEKWQKAIGETEVLRFYRPYLPKTTTTLSYTFLGASEINLGDTVVRKGKVVVDKPMIVLPKNMPQFSGFELEEELGIDENSLRFFFMVRGVHFPSLKYQNEVATIDIFEGEPKKAIAKYKDEMERQENLTTGLIFGPADLWQFSLLIYVTFLISRSVNSDIEKFIEDLRRKFLP